MDLSSETPAQLLGGAVTALAAVVVVLWRELGKSRKETARWQQKYVETLNERQRDSDLFLRALERKRSPSSDPPKMAS